jgi:hypothetical protein
MDVDGLLKKRRHREGLGGVVLNAPEEIERELTSAGLTNRLGDGKSEFTILFIRSRAEAEQLFCPTVEGIEHDSLLWLAYPKGGSSIETDVNRDKLWDLLRPTGYRPVAQVSIDKDWSAIRFRPEEMVKSRQAPSRKR